MTFDVLFALTLVLLAIALVRLRPCLFIIAANQLVTLRALSTIAEFGQPTRQWYLPSSVFSDQNLVIAARLFILSTALLAAGVLWPARARVRDRLPALPGWLLVLLGVYFVAMIAASRTILTHQYADPGRIVFDFNLSGIHALLVGLVLYELLRRVQTGVLAPLWAFSGLFALFIVTDYLKGSTGFATGALLGAAFLFFREEATVARRTRLLALSLACIAALALVVRGGRTALSQDAGRAVAGVAQTLQEAESSRERMAEGVESQLNGSQYAAHVLECISLYEAGIDRGWRSIVQPIEYTLRPSFLARQFDFSRSLEAPYELMQYYVHGGGIYIVGELYWNGGYACVALVFAAIIAFAFLCDTRSASSAFWAVVTCLFIVGLMQGIGYGFSQVARGMINGLIAVAIVRVLGRSQPQTAGGRAVYASA